MSFISNMSLSSSVWWTSRYSLCSEKGQPGFTTILSNTQKTWERDHIVFCGGKTNNFFKRLHTEILKDPKHMNRSVCIVLVPLTQGLVWEQCKPPPVFWAVVLWSCSLPCDPTGVASWSWTGASFAQPSSPWMSYTYKKTKTTHHTLVINTINQRLVFLKASFLPPIMWPYQRFLIISHVLGLTSAQLPSHLSQITR